MTFTLRFESLNSLICLMNFPENDVRYEMLFELRPMMIADKI